MNGKRHATIKNEGIAVNSYTFFQLLIFASLFLPKNNIMEPVIRNKLLFSRVTFRTVKG